MRTLQIQTERLEAGSLSLELEVRADIFPVLRELAAAGECEFTAPVAVRLNAFLVGEMVQVQATIRTELRLTCGRCLTGYTSPLETPCSLTFTRRPPGLSEDALPEDKQRDAEDLGLIYFQGEEVDLTEPAQEQIILSLPLRPLCSEACRGLCAQCGADLNQGACRCGTERPESPFAALRGINLSRD
jgi:uncharacterized protein